MLQSFVILAPVALAGSGQWGAGAQRPLPHHWPDPWRGRSAQRREVKVWECALPTCSHTTDQIAGVAEARKEEKLRCGNVHCPHVPTP